MADMTSDFSRRKFMAASLGALASAGLTGLNPTLSLAQASGEAAATGEMPVRTLGRTGIKVPVVSMGAGACNDPALVQACFESGMRLFDVAANYAFGRAEQMVGNALNKMKVRDQAVIVTKIHTPQQRNGLAPERHAPVMARTLEGSLRRMKTDYVDILLVHDVRDVATVKNEAIQAALQRFKDEGKVRAVGYSTHASMADVIDASADVEVCDIVLTSFNLTLADDTALMAAVDKAVKKNIGIIAMKTQAGGANFPNPETLRDYSRQVVNSAALKWVLGHENIATTIPGIANYDQMRENVATGSQLSLTEDEERFLSDNRVTLGLGFCRQCTKCLASCPREADIPSLMRTHMYAAQYGNFRLARQTLDEVGARRGLTNCTNCNDCAAKCANSVDIGRKIDDLKLMYA